MSLARVQDRYRALNGDHPMTPEDDAYVRSWCVEVDGGAGLTRAEVLDLMAAGELPLPAYLLSDGTPMVHPDFLAPVEAAGSGFAFPSQTLYLARDSGLAAGRAS